MRPALASSTQGREFLARLSSLEGDEARSAVLFQEIENESTEAKTFLARRAFSNKQWDEARRLTQLLMDQFPDDLSLRSSMEAINRAASAQ